MIRTSILLISSNNNIINSIKNCLNNSDYTINVQQNAKDLFMTVLMHNVKIIIVDNDSCEYSVVPIINNLQIHEYIPTIVITSDLSEVNINSIHGFKLHKEHLATYLPDMIKSVVFFKAKYDSTQECYNTIAIISNQTDKIFKNEIVNQSRDYAPAMEALISETFIKNLFTYNKPNYVLLSTFSDNDVEVFPYSLTNQVIKPMKKITLTNNKTFGINPQLPNECFNNFNVEEYSDINACDYVFEEEILKSMPKINNFTYFYSTNTAVIGLNYERKVSQLDKNIIRAFCINYNLIKNIYSQINKINESFIYTTNALARAAEATDDDTGNHIKRVNEYSKLLSQILRLDKKYVDTIYFSAQMHDVGKVHVPMEILRKPGKLTDDVFELIKLHTIYGAKIIGNSPNLQMAYEIALNHHEKYDGSGYPYKKSGEEIPLCARIVAIADIYDALRSPRVYKRGFSHDEAFDIITKGDGRVKPEHFDPEVLQAFVSANKKFDKINNMCN